MPKTDVRVEWKDQPANSPAWGPQSPRALTYKAKGRKFIRDTLEQNKDKTFVQRIYNMDKGPSLPVPDHPGYTMTHQMSDDTTKDGKHIAYPEILMEKGKLVHRTDRKLAQKAARSSGQFIEFPTPGDASYFARNYKKGLGEH